jgi:gamma-glutamyltranspeptidase/glutathione hydrolase
MAPTILYAPDGRVFGAVGAAGGATIIAQVAKTVVGIIDWKLPVEEATALPVVFAQGNSFAHEAAFRPGMAAAWTALGHKPQAAGLPIKTNALARVRGGWRGAGDPRSEGQAVALGRAGEKR